MFFIDDPAYIPLSAKFQYKTAVPNTEGAVVFFYSTNFDELRGNKFQSSNAPCSAYKNLINPKPKAHHRWLRYCRLTAGRSPPFLTF